MKKIIDFDYKGKKVLVRCDFNVSFSDKGEILDDYRIKNTLPTIKYLMEKGAKVILISHCSDSEEKPVSLKPVSLRLSELLTKRVKFLPDCRGERIKTEIEKMKDGEVMLLENVRFYKEEKENDEKFGRELADLGEIFINEGFAVSHRKHASVWQIPRFLPSAAGFLLEKEIVVLSQILKGFTPPLVIIIGGVKIETKAKTLLHFIKIADHILLGSKLGEVVLIKKQIILGRHAPDDKVIDEIDFTSSKIHLPIDGAMALKNVTEGYSRIGGVGTLKKEEEIFDIGPETIDVFKRIIKEAKTIFWNGPMGMYEDERFSSGTKEIAEAIIRNYSAFKVAGGGDTIAAVKKFHLEEKFDFLSTGGGAMLEFLAGEKLPGIEALNN